jgi:hypothetical protein
VFATCALGVGHFDAFGTAIASCALRHSAGGTMKFAKLSNEASRKASPPPCRVDLLHLVVARVASQAVDKLHGFLVVFSWVLLAKYYDRV